MSRGRPEDLSCKEVVELVNSFLEGELPVDERTRFEHHLVTCPACMTYVRQMRATVRVVAGTAVREGELPEETKQALLGAFRSWSRK